MKNVINRAFTAKKKEFLFIALAAIALAGCRGGGERALPIPTNG